MFELVHAGFDSLYVAFKGALLSETIDYLKKEKDRASNQNEPVLVEIGPGKVKAHLMGHGFSGGYAFGLSTGPTGAQFQFKADTDPNKWNVFVKPYAEAMAAHGYHGIRDMIFTELDAMGCRYTEHAINRVDFAMDFRVEAFEPRLDRFVSHSRAKVRPHWSKEQDTAANQPSAVLCGRALESVTIGKMPGRQIIVYDKRRDATAKRKLFWFEVWKINRYEQNLQIWRVELRAGKKELKDRWQIRTFKDLEDSIGDVFLHALTEVRYLDHDQPNGNVTRMRPHPLWLATGTALGQKLTDYRSGLTPDQVKEIEREAARENCRNGILGYSARLVAIDGLSNDEIEARLPSVLEYLGNSAIRDSNGKIYKSVQRARERLHFLAKRKEA